jgi:hypothetical protein
MYFDAHSFVEDLQAAGMRTIAITNNRGVCPEFGYSRGFDEFTVLEEEDRLERRGFDALRTVRRRISNDEYDSRKERFLDFGRQVLRHRDLQSLLAIAPVKFRNPGAPVAAVLEDTGAGVTNKMVRDRLDGIEEQFFLYLNYMEPHLPYEPPEEYAAEFVDDVDRARKLHTEGYNYDEMGADRRSFRWEAASDEVLEAARGLYDAEVKYLDAKLRELYETVTSQHEDTVFVVIGDHGENIGEYGMRGHQCGIWETLLRVPIIVAGPTVPNEAIEQNVSLAALGELLTGDRSLDDLGSERVYAEYTGLEGMFEVIGRDTSGFDEDSRHYLDNWSKCVIEGRWGLVHHSELPDVAFEARPDGIGTLDRLDDRSLDLYDLFRDWFSITETAGLDI